MAKKKASRSQVRKSVVRKPVNSKPSARKSKPTKRRGSISSKGVNSSHSLAGVRRTPRAFKQLWSLEDGVTFSSLNAWEQCQEHFALKYIDGLSKKKISGPIEFGNIFHFALEHRDRFSSSQETINAVTNQYRTWRNKTITNSEERGVLEFLCGLAQVTFPAYCEYWGKDDAKTHWIVKEGKFDVPYEVQTPEGPREIRLRGMRDALFRISNVLGVFETKTKSRISEGEIRDGLRADMQTLFYCLVTWLELGEIPKTIKYNIVRRADGGTPYRNKGMADKEYLKKVSQDIASRPEFYFIRFKVDLLAKDIQDFQKYTLDPLLVKFIHWWDHLKKSPSGRERFNSPYHSQSCSALVGKYGKSDMWDAIVNRNFMSYYQRSEVFPELVDSFQVTA